MPRGGTALAAEAEAGQSEPMSPAWISRCVDRVKGADAMLFNELACLPAHLTFTRPDCFFSHSLAGGLGWGLPAALGAQLACPDRLVIAAIGDGSYMFANPVACHQLAEAQALPVLTLVFNNGVWNAVRKSTASVYPAGHAVRSNRMPLVLARALAALRAGRPGERRLWRAGRERGRAAGGARARAACGAGGEAPGAAQHHLPVAAPAAGRCPQPGTSSKAPSPRSSRSGITRSSSSSRWRRRPCPSLLCAARKRSSAARNAARVVAGGQHRVGAQRDPAERRVQLGMVVLEQLEAFGEARLEPAEEREIVLVLDLVMLLELP